MTIPAASWPLHLLAANGRVRPDLRDPDLDLPVLEKRETLGAVDVSTCSRKECCIDAGRRRVVSVCAWTIDAGMRCSHFSTTLGGLGRQRVVKKKTENATHWEGSACVAARSAHSSKTMMVTDGGGEEEKRKG